MMNLKRATMYRDRALEVGVQEAADGFGVKVKSIKRAIQICNKALADAWLETAVKETPRYRKGWVPDFAKKGAERTVETPTLARADLADWCLPKGMTPEDFDSGYEPSPPITSRVLAIGDIHAPFDLDTYFDFVCSIYDQYDCDKVVFMGDVVDNHYSSYHEADPDGMVAGRELDLAISRLKRWHDRFPNATVLTGNHDRIVARKAQTAGIANRWIRGYADALETPSWNFTERIVIDGVQYIHGEGGTARTKSRKDLMSTVQGHLHTQAYTEWTVGAGYKIFGCQVGCGIDHESYAMAYARNFGKPAIGCAVILGGKTCINELMEL